MPGVVAVASSFSTRSWIAGGGQRRDEFGIQYRLENEPGQTDVLSRHAHARAAAQAE